MNISKTQLESFQASKSGKALTPNQVACLHKIADTVLPESLDVSEIVWNFKSGYSKGKAVDMLIEECKRNPFLTRVHLLLIYFELDNLFKHGEFV